MDVINIERSILSSFLFLNELGDTLEDCYTLDVRAFKDPFNKRIAEKLNEVNDGAYGFLSCEIEESVKGTKYEQDFIWILAQNPIPIKYSKKYHDKLVTQRSKGTLL